MIPGTLRVSRRLASRASISAPLSAPLSQIRCSAVMAHRNFATYRPPLFNEAQAAIVTAEPTALNLEDVEFEEEFDLDEFDRDMMEYPRYPDQLAKDWAPPVDPQSLVTEPIEWGEKSARVGLCGVKMGCMSVWDHWGLQFHVTVIWIKDNQVIRVNDSKPDKKGRVSVEVGGGDVKPKGLSKGMLVNFKKAGVAPKRKIYAFKTNPEAVLPIGYRLSAQHFKPGQFLDIQGTSVGKGFQGVIKRWGFGGQPASHGATKSHRSLGSTGQNTTPAKVFKGKKMPGQMGNRKNTIQNVRLYKVDTKRDLLFVRGQIPGHKDSWVRIQDAVRKAKHTAADPPPYPTYIPQPGDHLIDEIIQAHPQIDVNAVS